VSDDSVHYYLARASTPARNVGRQVSEEGIRMTSAETIVFLIVAILAFVALFRIVTIRQEFE
jgi:hypothetical protein